MIYGAIAKLETFTDKFVSFVKVTTTDGHIGWGQLSNYNADITAQVFHRQVAPWALGKDAADIGALITLVEAREHKFPGSYRCRANAGLDTALWDLHGRVAGKPVVELLGGAPKKLRAYASSMKRDITPQQMAKRFAKVAADLMGVDGVRLYHDQALFKEPGGGITPWHQDHVYWPLDTTNTITMWMPLVDVPNEIGSVVFASGSHERGDLGGSEIGDDSQLHFDRLIEREKFDLVSYAPMRAGDASFHAGWVLHGAPANETATMRSVMTIIYFADGVRVGEIDSPMRRADDERWLGSLPTGALAASPMNPLLWSR